MGKLGKYAIFAAIGLILVVVIYLLFRKKIQALSQQNQTSPSQNDPLTADEQATVKTIANGLHEDMKGWHWNILNRDPQPYQALASANDRITVGVYNYFNSNFCSTGETLVTWMNGDTYLSTSGSGNAVIIITDKFRRLNLV